MPKTGSWRKLRLVRAFLVTIAMVGLAVSGCRGAGTEPDPDRPDLLAPCPAGPHLLLGLFTGHSESEQSLVRFDANLNACQGVSLPRSTYGPLATVAGLPNGTDLVGFDLGSPSSRGGTVVRFEGTMERDRVTDEELSPVSMHAVAFGGAPAVAILWGEYGSTPTGARLDIVNQANLTELLGSWRVSSSTYLRAVAAPLTEGDRVLGFQSQGLQEYRVATGSESLATTGELQAAAPRSTAHSAGLDVVGDIAVASADEGVFFYRRGSTQAMLGPRYCRWAAVVGSPLPVEDADYVDVAADALDPENAALVVVSGDLDDGSDHDTHLFRLQFRGECDRIYSVPSTHSARAVAWSGR